MTAARRTTIAAGPLLGLVAGEVAVTVVAGYLSTMLDLIATGLGQ